jgi:hypothetical protein
VIVTNKGRSPLKDIAVVVSEQWGWQNLERNINQNTRIDFPLAGKPTCKCHRIVPFSDNK